MLKCLIFFMALYHVTLNHLIETCSKTCKTFIYKPYIQRIKYLVKLPDSKKLNDIALIGTHSSMSYKMEKKELRTQELNLAQQFKYGVRVLDITVWPKENSFEIYDGHNLFLDTEFSDVLRETVIFLNDNPSEFIIIFLHQVTPVLFKTRPDHSNCKIIDYHILNIWGGWRLVKNWSLSDPIGMYRDKILLASADGSFRGCTFNINSQCHIQNDQSISRNPESLFDDKWKSIIRSIITSNMRYYECYINDISFDDFVHDRRTIAKDAGYGYKDGCSRPMNDLVTEFFVNPHHVLTVVIADFVTQELIDAINDSNFPNSSWRIGWK